MRSLRSLLVLGAAALGSCTSATEGKRPTTITIAPTALSFDAIGDIQALTATVLDQDGNVMTGASPGWSTTAGSVAQVTSAGVVTSTGNGTAKVRATMGVAIAEIDVTVDQLPTAFTYAAGANGNGVNAVRGVSVPVRPGVRVLDANGSGVAGETVTFAVLSGGGSIGATADTTDATGEARVASWTLGPDLGENTLQATYGAFAPVVFTVTGVDDPCTPAGATPIGLGDVKNGTVATTDCLASDLKRYDLYKLDLASPSGVLLQMDGIAPLDAFLILLASDNSTVIAFHDDIVPGVNQDSRIGRQLAAGTYFIRTTSFDSLSAFSYGSYSLSVTAAAVGVATSIGVNAGQGQVVAPGSPVPIAPSVVVRDDLDQPVAGVTVDFATVPGVGTITGASAVTDANGVATLGTWTAAAGTNALSATASGAGITGNPVMFAATGNASTAGFNVSVRFAALPTASQLATFSAAASRWESIITGDLTNIPLNLAGGTCGSHPTINETVDDLIVYAFLEPIDGVGNVLGAAGSCLSRASTGTSLVGVMQFDTADLANLETAGTLNRVILHEMGHVIGIGTLWDYDSGLLLRDLLKNPSLPSSPGANTHFSGTNGIAGFNAIGGNTWTGSSTPLATSKVPVENTLGGEGTRDSHWRKSVLATELMTGSISAASSPLSELTVRSLIDIGYAVDPAQADPFFLTLSIRDAASQGPSVELKGDILRFPLLVVDTDGRLRGVTRRK